jgi:hypothetical protein
MPLQLRGGLVEAAPLKGRVGRKQKNCQNGAEVRVVTQSANYIT